MSTKCGEGGKGGGSSVYPNKCSGKKTGLFSTRTPHRPNPIILSLAKILRISGKNIFLTGADLIDGTPIIDIKPYIPDYDSIPDAKVPSWILAPPVEPPKWKVEIPEDNKEFMQILNDRLKFTELYKDEPEEFLRLLREVLSLDLRSTSKRERMATNQVTNLHSVVLCGLVFRFSITEEKLTVLSASPFLQESNLEEVGGE